MPFNLQRRIPQNTAKSSTKETSSKVGNVKIKHATA
jgi:hypothetical protein